MASLRTWFKATQPRSFVASLVGVALGTAIAWDHRRTFDLAGLVLAAIGVVCLHAGTNMSNDSIDFQRGVDDLPPHLVSPFTGGARVLPDAAVSLEAHRRVWIGFFAVAAVIGLVLAVTRPNGWILLVLGAEDQEDPAVRPRHGEDEADHGRNGEEADPYASVRLQRNGSIREDPGPSGEGAHEMRRKVVDA